MQGRHDLGVMVQTGKGIECAEKSEALSIMGAIKSVPANRKVRCRAFLCYQILITFIDDDT